ncbi:MAG: hypothetical protein ING36_02440 [Burkholderiales bacterium]|jgi:hypothetical protein|nr:hypothetical protein [Burkholderiales bacterium]
MDKQLNDLLYGLPPGIDYTDDLFRLDAEDIPTDRIPKFLALLEGEDEQAAFRAAYVLCGWGQEDGFKYMRDFVMRKPPMKGGWYEHRLRGYDDSYRFALSAFVRYWAMLFDRNKLDGETARKEIFGPLQRIVELSNSLPFEIDGFFWLVEEEGFTEYLPALKAHLQAIIKEPDKHHWKVADCAHLLMKFDPEFVNQTLASHGYTLADFPNK